MAEPEVVGRDIEDAQPHLRALQSRFRAGLEGEPSSVNPARHDGVDLLFHQRLDLRASVVGLLGAAGDRVLLDAGTWIYTREGIIMKDRAPSIGDRGLAEVGDFTGIVGRIEDRYYSKILVRNFHSPDFWYDDYLWDVPSGIRDALLENYREIGKIEPVTSAFPDEKVQYLFQEISILVPDEP